MAYFFKLMTGWMRPSANWPHRVHDYFVSSAPSFAFRNSDDESPEVTGERVEDNGLVAVGIVVVAATVDKTGAVPAAMV